MLISHIRNSPVRLTHCKISEKLVVISIIFKVVFKVGAKAIELANWQILKPSSQSRPIRS